MTNVPARTSSSVGATWRAVGLPWPCCLYVLRRADVPGPLHPRRCGCWQCSAMLRHQHPTNFIWNEKVHLQKPAAAAYCERRLRVPAAHILREAAEPWSSPRSTNQLMMAHVDCLVRRPRTRHARGSPLGRRAKCTCAQHFYQVHGERDGALPAGGLSFITTSARYYLELSDGDNVERAGTAEKRDWHGDRAIPAAGL